MLEVKIVERILKDLPNLKIIEKWMKEANNLKKGHVLKKIILNYKTRKSKKYKEKYNISVNSNNVFERILASMYLTSYFSSKALLNYLGNCIVNLHKLKGFNNLLRNLKNSEQFWDTMSEVEFNSYFSKRYKLKLEPILNTKLLDSEIFLDKRGILFEILTPQTYGPLKNSSKAVLIPNRSKNKILDKLEKQILPSKDYIRTPLVLVINGSRSEIDVHDIEDAIFGRLKLMTIHDKKTGKMIHEYWDRDKNSLNDKNSDSKYISAVLFYKMEVRLGYGFFEKTIISNPESKYPLNKNEYKRLLRFDLTEFTKLVLS